MIRKTEPVVVVPEDVDNVKQEAVAQEPLAEDEVDHAARVVGEPALVEEVKQTNLDKISEEKSYEPLKEDKIEVPLSQVFTEKYFQKPELPPKTRDLVPKRIGKFSDLSRRDFLLVSTGLSEDMSLTFKPELSLIKTDPEARMFQRETQKPERDGVMLGDQLDWPISRHDQELKNSRPDREDSEDERLVSCQFSNRHLLRYLLYKMVQFSL